MIWRSPGGQAYLERVAGDLAQGRNALMVVPKPLLTGRLTEALRDVMRRRGLPPLERRAAGPGTSGVPPDLAGVIRGAAAGNAATGTGADGSRDGRLHALYGSFMAGGGLRFLAVEGLDALPQELRAAAAGDISRWASVARERPGPAGRPAGLRIVVPLTPSFGQVKSDLFLAVHAFWAAVTRNDQDWAFNRIYNEHPSDDPADYLYLKALCLAVCQEDFGLMERMIARKPATLKDAFSMIREHPLSRLAERLPRARESAAARSEPPAFNHGRPPRRPVAPEEALMWSEGLLSAVGCAGVHPALMRYEELERAVASSQRELFLPLVDYVHSLIVASVEKGHGPDVWERNAREEEERNEILTEISPLAFCIKRKIGPMGDFDSRLRERALECAFAWRRIRHSTAHNRMASIELIRNAMACYERLRPMARGLLAPARPVPDWLRNPEGPRLPARDSGEAGGPAGAAASGQGSSGAERHDPGTAAGAGAAAAERHGPGTAAGAGAVAAERHGTGTAAGAGAVSGPDSGQASGHVPGARAGPGPGAATVGRHGSGPVPGASVWLRPGAGTRHGPDPAAAKGQFPGAGAGHGAKPELPEGTGKGAVPAETDRRTASAISVPATPEMPEQEGQGIRAADPPSPAGAK
ncbi:MAG: hypothetical protein LBQ79_12345 [Deltaproteobacteria bacterium]|jgi:hypothetical protein|nr:hypothetical protein [Deltaproteobacteria bacterium]